MEKEVVELRERLGGKMQLDKTSQELNQDWSTLENAVNCWEIKQCCVKKKCKNFQIHAVNAIIKSMRLYS